MTTSELKNNRRRNIIRVANVSKIYRGDGVEYGALRNIDLSIDEGEFIAVVGESGCGKSTLLNMLAGIDRPSEGEIYVGDQPLHGMNQEALSRWRGKNVGIVFQFFQLIPTLTVIENVMLPMDFCGTYSPRQRRRVAADLLERVNILEQAHKLPAALSGGQQQRAAVARALANDPPLLMADEPTGNLDSTSGRSLFALFEQLSWDGKTLIVVTHSDELAARAERVVTLTDGRIGDCGRGGLAEPEEVRR